MKAILENKEQIWTIISSAITIFAVVATMTKNESDNKIVEKIYKVINILGLNFGKAKNK